MGMRKSAGKNEKSKRPAAPEPCEDTVRKAAAMSARRQTR
jgi:hypothetical protein